MEGRIKPGFIFLALVILMTASLISAKEPADSVLPYVGGTYTVTSADEYLCLTVDAWNTDKNGLLNMWECQKPFQTNQLWTVTKVPKWSDTQAFQWVSKSSGYCLSVGKDLISHGNNDGVYQYPCQEEPSLAQLWKTNETDPFYYTGHFTPGISVMQLVGNLGKCLSWLPKQGGTTYTYDCDVKYKNQHMLNYVQY